MEGWNILKHRFCRSILNLSRWYLYLCTSFGVCCWFLAIGWKATWSLKNFNQKNSSYFCRSFFKCQGVGIAMAFKGWTDFFLLGRTGLPLEASARNVLSRSLEAEAFMRRGWRPCPTAATGGRFGEPLLENEWLGSRRVKYWKYWKRNKPFWKSIFASCPSNIFQWNDRADSHHNLPEIKHPHGCRYGQAFGIFTLSLAMCRHGCSRMVVFWPSDQYLQNDSISKISTFFPVTLWMLRNCWDLWQAISIHQKLVSWTDGDLWIFSFGISPSSCAAEPLGWWGDGVMSQDQLAAHVTAANVSAMLYVCGSGAQKAASALVGGRNRN